METLETLLAQDWQALLLPWSIRWIVLATLLSGAGGSFAALWFSPEVARRQFRWRLFWLGFFGTLAMLALIAHQLLAIGGSLDNGVREIYFRSPLWPSHRLILAAGGVLMLGAVLPWWLFRLNLLALPLLAVGLAQSGHSLALGSLSGVVLSLHVTLAALWLGHLVPLSRLCRQTLGERLAQRVIPFSKAATFWVPILLLLGAWLAYQLLPNVAALLNTHYGLVLLIKIIAVLYVMVLGALAKWTYVPWVAGRGSSRFMLANTALWQNRLIVLVALAATAWLSAQA